MIVSSINDKLRNKLYQFDEQEAFFYIDGCDIEQRDNYLRLIIIDALKILEIKVKKGSLMLADTKQLYFELNQIDIEDLLSLLKNDYNYFSNVFLQAQQFYWLPIINRCYIVEELGNYDFNRKLTELNPFHLIDVVAYKIQHDLDNINYYYRDFKDTHGPEYAQRFYPIALELLRELKEENIEQFDRSYLEIIKTFYMTYKYIDTMSNVDFAGKKPIKLLEQESITSAREKILNDVKLFCEVISYYFLYANNELVDQDEVKVFCKKHIREEMKKKLEIND